ncbi:hypothetical protein CEXT_443601 [Caerostris extrusa]|uniref:Uncharacterized protein n=1 Tax=Caerostris extrusa TaxID=172846 RepID=A0AAV4S8U6_CAEEX|nr:hypothetical protein CEXT_443601 [Caerostris extrusa]
MVFQVEPRHSGHPLLARFHRGGGVREAAVRDRGSLREHRHLLFEELNSLDDVLDYEDVKRRCGRPPFPCPVLDISSTPQQNNTKSPSTNLYHLRRERRESSAAKSGNVNESEAQQGQIPERAAKRGKFFKETE